MRKEICAKASHKMLVKLTKAVSVTFFEHLFSDIDAKIPDWMITSITLMLTNKMDWILEFCYFIVDSKFFLISYNITAGRQTQSMGTEDLNFTDVYELGSPGIA